MRPSSVAFLKFAFLKFALLSLLLGGADSGLLNRFWSAGGDARRVAETMPRRGDARRGGDTRKKDHHLHVHRRARPAETPPEKKEETQPPPQT
jgi:hypothetical protein